MYEFQPFNTWNIHFDFTMKSTDLFRSAGLFKVTDAETDSAEIEKQTGETGQERHLKRHKGEGRDWRIDLSHLLSPWPVFVFLCSTTTVM